MMKRASRMGPGGGLQLLWGTIRAFAIALVLVWATSGAAFAHKGKPVGWTLEAASETILIDSLTFNYEPGLDGDARRLAGGVAATWEHIESELGMEIRKPLVINFVRHSGLVARATSMPQWVAGVASPRRGEIVIARHSPDGSRTELDSLLRHELVHIALHRAIRGQNAPRWFHEGIADSIGAEVDLGRFETLAGTVYGAGVPTLERLEKNFRGDDREAMVAYAAARDFATFLRFKDEGIAFRDLLEAMQGGMDFEQAIADAYGRPLGELDRQWREGLTSRFVWYPIVGSGALPMALGGPLLVVAWIRRRREYHRGLARLAAEERSEMLVRRARDAQRMRMLS